MIFLSQLTKSTHECTKCDLSNTDVGPRTVPFVRHGKTIHTKHGQTRRLTSNKMALTRRKRMILLCWWWKRRVEQLHSTRRLSVHPFQRMRNVHGEYHHLLPELFEDSQKFVDYLRMQPTRFHDLLVQCAADLTMVGFCQTCHK